MLSGLGQAIVYLVEGVYISQCSSEANAGFYFGYQWTWYMLSLVIGNLLGCVLLDYNTGPAFFVELWSISVIVTILFYFL